MAKVDLNSRLSGSGNTDTYLAYGVEVGAGGLRTVGALPKFNLASVTTLTTAGAETYTAAQLATGLIARDPNGAGRSDTTDTAANIISGLGLANDGDCAAVYLINTADAAETITLLAGANVTFSNIGQTLAQNESAILLFRRASSTTVTAYILGA